MPGCLLLVPAPHEPVIQSLTAGEVIVTAVSGGANSLETHAAANSHLPFSSCRAGIAHQLIRLQRLCEPLRRLH